MDALVEGAARFRKDVFPLQRERYKQLARDGQAPRTLFISCSDSRVMPEIITQSGPGDVFVCRNAGNVVPAFGDEAGGVAAAVEFAVVALGVRDIVVCGHTECGAMKGLLQPELLRDVPSVAKWLGHCRCAHDAFERVHAQSTPEPDRLRVLAMENVAAQLTNLRTHPCVAARVATGELALHGWLFDIEHGTVFAMDRVGGVFLPLEDGQSSGLGAPSGCPTPARLFAGV